MVTLKKVYAYGFVERTRFASYNFTCVDDYYYRRTLIGIGANQTFNRHINARLFHRLPPGCAFEGLSGVYEATREYPASVCGFDTTSKKEEFAVLPHNSTGCNSRVQVLDIAAVLTDEALWFAFLDKLELQASPATDAEFIARVFVVVGHEAMVS